ncbi:MAG: hypothetical protein H6807_11645 [Planctomycetes bacterium]|nr:hypothetical protein [Planctomycetota bacterium]
MHRCRSILLAVVLLAPFSGLAAQSVRLAPSAAYPTIQAAIAAAQNGDVVEVPPGTYSESLDLLGKQIVLRSQAGRALTILDSPTRLILAAGGETTATRIEGFTFRGLHGDDSAAIEVTTAGLSIVDCFFDQVGGAPSASAWSHNSACVRAWDADLIVLDSRFEGCHAPDGLDSAAGQPPTVAGSGGAIWATLGNLEIRRCEFIGNRAGTGGATTGLPYIEPGFSGSGGALHLDELDAVIEDSLFLGNRTGLVPLDRASGNIFTWSLPGGGAIRHRGDHSHLRLRRCRFIDNLTAENPLVAGEFWGSGGAVDASLTVVVIERCLFHGNRAGWGGAVWLDQSQSVDSTAHVVSTSLFIANEAQHSVGAAYLRDDLGVRVLHCDFIDNVAPDGAAIDGGGGDDNGRPLLVANSIFTGSSGPLLGSYLMASLQRAHFVNDLIAETGLPGTGNFAGDPGFVAPTLGDYRLRHDSICIDAGATLSFGPLEDWDGQSLNRGRAPDVGADEFLGLGAAASGNVPDGQGGLFDLLLVNGGNGGSQRYLELPLGSAPLWSLDSLPGSAGVNHFVLWGRIGIASFEEAIPVVFAGAELCFAPPPVDPFNPAKFTFADSFGSAPFALVPQAGPAPFAVQAPPIGYPIAVTVQGLILDDQQQFLATNAIAVEIR